MKTGHADKARELFNDGYNCSQAVLGTFAEDAGLDVKTALRLSAPFGGGMGRMREVCGTISGATFVLSMLYGYSDPKDFANKKSIYCDVQSVANKFKEANGSIICRELLGLDKAAKTPPTPEKRTQQYYKKRPCADLCSDCAGFLEEYIAQKQNIAQQA